MWQDLITLDACCCGLFEGIALADDAVYNLATHLACCAVWDFLAATYTLSVFGVEILLAETAIILGERIVMLRVIAGEALFGCETYLTTLH